jgi:RNA polymerase sigma factor (sigma-70 family)
MRGESSPSRRPKRIVSREDDGLAEDPKTRTDEELMVAYAQGNENAFWELYGRYSGRVYGFLFARARNRTAVDDLFQTAFLKLHQSRHRYDPAFAFAPWIFTIVRNVWIDHLRRTAARREDELSGELPAPAPAEQPTLPELKHLDERQREALKMRYGEDLSFDEISKRLKTSPANVRQIVSRGLKRLRVKS